MKKITIKPVKEQPETVSLAFVSVAFMPNGELIHRGKTVGRFKTSQGDLYEQVKNSEIEKLETFRKKALPLLEAYSDKLDTELFNIRGNTGEWLSIKEIKRDIDALIKENK